MRISAGWIVFCGGSPVWLPNHLKFSTIPDVQCELWGNMEDWFHRFFVGGRGSTSAYSPRMQCLGPTGVGALWTISDLGLSQDECRKLTLYCRPFEERADPALWANLVHLEVTERCVESLVRLHPAALPSVTELLFVFEVPEKHDKDTDRMSILCYPRTTAAPILIPRLRTLEIRPGSLSVPVMLDPEDISDFMQLCIAFDSPQLNELVIWNAELLTLVPGGVARLIDSVTHLRVILGAARALSWVLDGD
ncbi:hypothetical protein AURDEDRAFT_159779, partial [Auricularia subglabra TFB-10046 SS5]